MQWTIPPDFAVENFMPPPGPFYNPYWNVMPPVMEPYMGGPYGGPMLPFMGYGAGLPNVPFGPSGMMPPLIPPHSDPAERGMHMNDGALFMSREEFEGRKAGLRCKRGLEIGGPRELPNDQEYHMEISSSGDVSSKKLKNKSIPPPPPSVHNHRHREKSPATKHRHRERKQQPSQPIPPAASSKKKSSHDGYYEHDDKHRHRRHRMHRKHRRSESSPPAAKTGNTDRAYFLVSNLQAEKAKKKLLPTPPLSLDLAGKIRLRRLTMRNITAIGKHRRRRAGN